jgi:hypothetical protein
MRQMGAGQNAKNGERLLDGAKFPRRPGTLTLTTPAERLDYIAAMVHQLKIMSAQANCQTLSGLLEMAYREAVRQRNAGS